MTAYPKTLQGKESHTNTQKLDQDIKFTPRRTWPPWSNDVIRPTVWPCGRMLWSAHIPLANEQGLWISLSYQNAHHQIIINGFKYLENRFALQDWITELKFIFQIWDGLQPFLARGWLTSAPLAYQLGVWKLCLSVCVMSSIDML